jgi:environmental stress-induced protein Ves
VEDETSTFTSLPGIARHLMILDGTLNITHEGHYTKQLRPMDLDSFDGGWHTTGIGRVTDFNLMTSGNCNGIVLGTTIRSGQSQTKTITPSIQMLGCYVYAGGTSLVIGENTYVLHEKDFIMISGVNAIDSLTLQAISDSRIVFSLIALQN